MGTRRARPAAAALLALTTGTLTGWSSAPTQAGPGQSTLDRPSDPVVLTGDQVDALVGTAPERVVGFRAVDGGWEQVPVQVDERKDTTMDQVYGLPASQTFYGSSINVPVNVYADADTFTGPDTDPDLDADDEIAFLARDAGGEAGDLAAPEGTTGEAVEVQLAEPSDPDAAGHVYLFESDGSLEPGAGERYVDYEFRLESGDYRDTYDRTDGPNPEDSTVTGSTYRLHYADRWTMDELALLQGNQPDADLIDRVKYDIQLACARNEDTFNDEEGAFVANRSGPVRAIRSWVGANSGPNTQNTQTFYDTFYDTHVNLRVHAIPNVGSHIDLSREAVGMTYRNAQVPEGVTIDGEPDEVPSTGPPRWWTYSGEPGGIAMAATYDVTATSPAQTAYVDDATPSIAQCTGDSEAIGDSGAFFPSWIDCTDPGLGCTERLDSTLRMVATAPDVTPAGLQRLSQQFLEPLDVTVDGQGGGGGPGPAECVTATNADHVQAGRAMSWLLFAWAAGSDDYLGLTPATTSLRQEGPGTWTRVDGC